MTLDEFTALMKGELSGRDPTEAARMVFVTLSQSNGDRRFDGLITLGKLQAVCRDSEVCQHQCCMFLFSVARGC